MDEPRRRDHRGARRASSVTASSPRRARSPRSRTASARVYGVQFHPEVVHTERGQEILKRVPVRRVRLPADVDEHVRSSSEAVAEIRAQVGDERVICGLSGGVDSAVAAALVHKAVGDQLTCVFVDTGLLRLDEAEQVEETFRRQFHVDLVHVKAADRFLDALDDVTEPGAQAQDHRRDVHPRVRGGRARPLATPASSCRARCTPTSSSRAAATTPTIKSHHNVGGLPDDMEFELVEPLRNLFKDEVRAVGEELGLPEEIVWRQPFPGPGPRGADHRRRSRPSGSRSCGRPTRSCVEEIRRAGLVPRDLAELRGAARGAHRRRDGRRPHLRVPGRSCARSRRRTR